MPPEFVTRFAPSPTGPLHLGHAYSALLAYDMAVAAGGRFLLRIEDIDHARCRPEWEAQIFDDLTWLGVVWENPVLRQSNRMPAYQSALQDLARQNLVYPCTCSRQDILLASGAPQEGVKMHGPEGTVYPGTCRGRDGQEGTVPGAAMRLNMDRALDTVLDSLTSLEFLETAYLPGRHSIDFSVFKHAIGDVALARRDMGTSYHLSVVIDDAAQGISHVVRGQDLFEATQIHVLLQRLLGLATPVYHHHRLIRDDYGKRLAKRDDARALSRYRADGATRGDIRRMVGL